MEDRLWERPVFTVKEAADICRVSRRTMYDWIKTEVIKCLRHTADTTKREKKLIARGELERLGFLQPLKAEVEKSSPKEILEQEEVKAHINEVYKMKENLKSELWLPLLHYLPTRDLSFHHDAYGEHTIYWTDSNDGLPIIKLPVESEDNFLYFRQHTKSSKIRQYLHEWKQVGGQYVYNRSILLNNIKRDIQTETDLPTVLKDKERGILEGFSWVIFRHLFSQVCQDERKAEQLARKAISLASEGRWNEAVDVNKNVIKMFPGDSNALKRLGKALMELQRYPSAKEAYSRALEIDPYDSIAQKLLKELLQKYPDDNGIAKVDGGRYRIVSRGSDLWILAVFTDDAGENIASVYPNEIDLAITTFSNLLRKYKASSEIGTILEIGRNVNQLKRSLSQELKAITLKSIAETRCDECPI